MGVHAEYMGIINKKVNPLCDYLNET